MKTADSSDGWCSTITVWAVTKQNSTHTMLPSGAALDKPDGGEARYSKKAEPYPAHERCSAQVSVPVEPGRVLLPAYHNVATSTGRPAQSTQ